MMKAPAEKNIGYFFASVGAVLVVATTIWFMGSIFMSIWYRIAYGSMYYGF
jgi:hypothetical protein